MEKINEKERLKKYLIENGLHMATKSDFEEIANIAGKAYVNYPLCIYFSGGKYDEEDLKQTIRVSLYSMFDEGIIVTDSEEVNGCAILLPPGFNGLKTSTFVWNGGYKIIFRQGIKAIIRMSNYEAFAMNLRKKYTNNEDWYLYNIFINPQHKGKKICSKLMRPLLNFCKLNKKICYLETNSDDNIPIYKHFGFKLVEKCLVPDTNNLQHYAMLFDGK